MLSCSEGYAKLIVQQLQIPDLLKPAFECIALLPRPFHRRGNTPVIIAIALAISSV
jgi:hypothetical protein